MLTYLDTLIGFAVIMLGASLLITILTQMMSALFSHRGANLLWGLETMFQNIPNSPALNQLASAQRVAKDALSHPLISDSIFSVRPQWLANHVKWFMDRMRLATAISPDELAAILKDLAAKYAAAPPAGLPAGLAAEISTLLDAPNPSADRRIKLLTGVGNLAAVTNPQVAPLLTGTVNSMQNAIGELDAWFGATMDRVSERFTTYARIWTIAFAIAFAGITGMNSVSVLSDLYSNSDLRQQMVGAAPQMVGLAETVTSGAVNDLYNGAVAKALTDANASAGASPTGIKSKSDGDAWITANVANAAQKAAALAAFPKEIDIASRALIEQRAKDAAKVSSLLTNSRFDVLQVRWNTNNPPKWPDVPGIFATAALLSLGAPFWFNLLKSLTNLRPILATKQDSDTK